MNGILELENLVGLGILCLLLMMAISIWLIYIFQYSQEIYKLQRTLNIPHQENSTMQNDRYLIEEMLKNKSIDYVALKMYLDTLKRTLNRCYQETKFVVDSKQHRGERVEGHWFCCGVKCYYFIMDNKRWSECKHTCRDCSLSLLTIDDDDELNFLQLQIKPNSYWIGLSYDPKTRKWQWIDDGPSKLCMVGHPLEKGYILVATPPPEPIAPPHPTPHPHPRKRVNLPFPAAVT
ncbi:killer cell lectin-like receptor 2 [Peromyscus californicus insignis]|uniref:killer cell lectin-like receptor 2 n=1 Tax=Peromyscus californicus insignis TaxID=564181 RepID=UPI0022A77EE0|nr:killer cell lectin-like receptor 2 [Peromyscus californicus insignis]